LKTIVVLGSGGFLADQIERHYRSLGWRIVSIGRDADVGYGDARYRWELPHSEFAHLLAVERPQICVNAAGRSSVSASVVEPLADFEASTVLTYRVLDDLRRRSPATIFIHLSSAAVYGNPVELPVREDAVIAPISPYGWHKRLSEMVLEEHARQFGMQTASLRIFSTYGVGLKRQVVWDLASRAVAYPGQPLLLQGCPADSRDFINGSDVARAVQLVAERGELVGECYNVASGIETPVYEIAELVLRLLSGSSQIRFDGQRRAGNPSRWHADITKVQSLGFSPRLGLEDGVRQVIGEIERVPA
jgi:UDP-glucose 4-epimerase